MQFILNRTAFHILLNEVLTNLFLFLPKLGHIFQSLAFRFGYELPYEDGRHYADNAIKSIGEHVAELISHFPEAHVVHRQESRRNNEVENPLECHRNSYCSATDGIREDFGNQYPADRSPTEHKRSAVNHNADNGDYRRKSCDDVTKRHTECSYGHTDGTGNKQRLASPFLNRKYGQQGKQDIHDTHEHCLHHRISHPHCIEYTRGKIQYGIDTGLTPECERIYTTNLLLDVFHEDNWEDVSCDLTDLVLKDILADLLKEAVTRGIIEDSIGYRDLFDTRLMNCLLPRPAQVQNDFWRHYQESPESATQFYYKFSQDSDYIRRYRIKKDRRWNVDTDYGTLDITINLSKPEKDPKAIAAARNASVSAYPKCQLCMENEGYAGRLDHPARENHRIIPITVNDSKWGFQYSPYVYYNEHCIVFNGEHTPMKIERQTFVKLFDFIKQFPHYFLGSNADLPIVGGSILSHDHFQGGHYTFAMEKAPVIQEFTVKGFEDVTAGIVKWPLSVIRLQSEDVTRVIDLADHILQAWRGYTDEAAFIFAETDGQPHNTITPIARMRDGKYELDLTLRNNITTEEHPLGVYHPHKELHHIKKENIGLIEVMGLAVLPARLKEELELLAEYILEGKDISSNEKIEKHAAWVAEFLPKYDNLDKDNIQDVLRKEVGNVFVHVLEDAGVYKCTPEGRDAFMRFINTL